LIEAAPGTGIEDDDELDAEVERGRTGDGERGLDMVRVETS